MLIVFIKETLYSLAKIFNICAMLSTDSFDIFYFFVFSYCEGVLKMTNQSMVQVDFKNLIADPDVKCNEELVNHLLWDAELVNSIELYKLVTGDILAVSLTTAGGRCSDRTLILLLLLLMAFT